jgi:ribosome-associated protein
MLEISNTVFIADREIEISAIRSQGAGGQNVNKVASAIHLRFDIPASSLPDRYKQRLLQISDQRITSEGVIVIKAQEHRSQEQNREEALRRLQELIKSAIVIPKRRKPSKATRSSQRKRLDSKTKRGTFLTFYHSGFGGPKSLGKSLSVFPRALQRAFI